MPLRHVFISFIATISIANELGALRVWRLPVRRLCCSGLLGQGASARIRRSMGAVVAWAATPPPLRRLRCPGGTSSPPARRVKPALSRLPHLGRPHAVLCSAVRCCLAQDIVHLCCQCKATRFLFPGRPPWKLAFLPQPADPGPARAPQSPGSGCSSISLVINSSSSRGWR